MFCDLCERSSRIIDDERDCFEHLLDRVRQHYRDLQLRLRKTSVEMEELKCDNDSLRRENETLRAAYAGQRLKETQECTPKKFHDPYSGTQPLLPDDDWESVVRSAQGSASGGVVDKENSPINNWQPEKKSHYSPDRDLFEDSEEQRPKLPVRAKTTTKAGGWSLKSKKDILNETITSKKVPTFDKPPARVKYLMDAPKTRSRISTAVPDVSQKKHKLRQTTLNFSRFDSDATFCEELINATPEKHAPSSRLRDRISRPFGRFDTPPVLRSRNANNPEKSKARQKKKKKVKSPENPQELHTFVTPDGFWDLDFPPPAKTQPPSPNDPLAKRPKKKQ